MSYNNASPSSSTESSSKISVSRSSARRRKPPPSRCHSPPSRAYPQGPPTTTEEKLFHILDAAKISAGPLAAADDMLALLFDDPRQSLRVRKTGSRRLSPQDSSLLKTKFRTTFTAKIDPDYMTWNAECLTESMKSHGIVTTDHDEADAFTNLALRYSRLKHSKRVEVGPSPMVVGSVQARIVAKAHIPKGTLLLELGGLMSADAIEPLPAESNHDTRSSRKRKASSRSLPAFERFSVIWKGNGQRGGRREDRLLLGPARFINHSCSPNSKLIPFPKTNAWGVETCRNVQDGEEITVSYGDHYFGPGECACAPCVAALGAASVRETPATSVAPSPAPSSVMEEHRDEGQPPKKRQRLNPERELDASRPAKKTRR